MTYKDLKEIKNEIAKLENFKCGCYVCHSKNHPKGMTFHHIKYIDTEKKYSDFPQNVKGRIEYYMYLKPIIEGDPERFAYICNPHHYLITMLLRFSVDKQERLFELVRLSR